MIFKKLFLNNKNMYIKVSGINKIIDRRHIVQLFTFTNPLYKTISTANGEQIVLYTSLIDLYLSQKLNNRLIIDKITVELVESKCIACRIPKTTLKTKTVFIRGNKEINLNDIKNFYKTEINCHIKKNTEWEYFCFVEFKREIELRRFSDQIEIFSFEDYIFHIERKHL